jgi:hypothetical protein
LARVSCEKERRAREREARLDNQRQMEAMRNKAALDRALAPPYRPEGRRPMFRCGGRAVKKNIVPKYILVNVSCNFQGLKLSN